ncbi:MAG: Stealth CR1 domain-containing protein [Clostridia bacterium]|nr:Stealth CR1 domain-containing protein [Clostridia bacterium]
MSSREPIDFVITWVDGRDPAWLSEKRQYSTQKLADNREVRYRDWELLRYWFRGVEKFAPWVRTIHFVTWGHYPEWLNTDNPKLHIVKHSDYIPQEYLPTFNSNAIESLFHKIEGLSEKFVYFNDDMFCLKDLTEQDFFQNGKVCDMLAFQPVVANKDDPVMSCTMLNNSLVLAKYFDKRENVKKQPGAYFNFGYPPLYFAYNFLELFFPKFTGFYSVHGPAALYKQTYRELWEKEEQLFTKTSSSRFRNNENITIYLIREWQKLSGNFTPKNIHKYLAYYNVGEQDDLMLNTIARQKRKFICLNDGNNVNDFDRTKERIQQAFEQILPEFSSFEKQ